VTVTAKHAMGEMGMSSNLVPQVGDRADFVILHDCSSVSEAVLNPPFGRTTIKAGKTVAHRRQHAWIEVKP
jgi:hypothetical protein